MFFWETSPIIVSVIENNLPRVLVIVVIIHWMRRLVCHDLRPKRTVCVSCVFNSVIFVSAAESENYLPPESPCPRMSDDDQEEYRRFSQVLGNNIPPSFRFFIIHLARDLYRFCYLLSLDQPKSIACSTPRQPLGNITPVKNFSAVKNGKLSCVLIINKAAVLRSMDK
jgi:hypothetical protein